MSGVGTVTLTDFLLARIADEAAVRDNWNRRTQ